MLLVPHIYSGNDPKRINFKQICTGVMGMKLEKITGLKMALVLIFKLRAEHTKTKL